MVGGVWGYYGFEMWVCVRCGYKPGFWGVF